MRRLALFGLLILFWGTDLALFSEEKPSIYQRDYAQADKLKYQAALDYWKRDNNLAAARVELEEYLELYPNGLHLFDAYILLGQFYQWERNYTAAIRIYDTFYHRFPDQGPALEAKFIACRMRLLIGDKKKGIECLELLRETAARQSDILEKVVSELHILGLMQTPEKKSEKNSEKKQENNFDTNKTLPEVKKRETPETGKKEISIDKKIGNNGN